MRVRDTSGYEQWQWFRPRRYYSTSNLSSCKRFTTLAIMDTVVGLIGHINGGALEVLGCGFVGQHNHVLICARLLARFMRLTLVVHAGLHRRIVSHVRRSLFRYACRQTYHTRASCNAFVMAMRMLPFRYQSTSTCIQVLGVSHALTVSSTT